MKRINFTRLAFFILLAVLRQTVSAQVKIGANPTVINPNSLLEMEQNTVTGRYGMRLPRVALDSTSSFAPLAAHVQGMTVYNTATAGTGFTAVSPGIYYNDGTNWIRASKESGVASGYVYYLHTPSVSYPTTGVNPAINGTVVYSSNDGSDFAAATGSWTCPSSGVYRFEWQDENTSGTGYTFSFYNFYFQVNGTNLTGGPIHLSTGANMINYGFVSLSRVAYVNAGDVLTLNAASNSGWPAAISVAGSLTITEITGNGVTSSSSGPNQAPTAQNVSISGNALLGQTLTSTFTYNDYEGNPQNGTIRQWYRADDASGTNEAPIAGATGITYAVNYADMGKYIRVGITPGASVGATPGTIAYSAYKSVYDCGAPTATVTFTYNGASVTYGTLQSPTTGRCFLDRNLGATAVATAYNDANGYGHYFQWGRPDDGHQVPTSSTSTVLSTTDFPGSAFFITPPNASPYDWRDNNNSNRWEVNPQGPCPTGWHVPRESEWVAETGTSNYSTAYAQLKLTSAGARAWDGNVYYSGSIYGQYWSSSKSTADSRGSSFHYWDSNGPYNSWDWRASGHSVRCIKD